MILFEYKQLTKLC